MLLDSKCWYMAKGIITPVSFFDPLHAQIFAAIGGRVEENRSATPLAIAPMFDSHELIDGLSVKQYLGKLATSASSTRAVMEYATELRELAARRQLIAIAVEIDTAARNPLAHIAGACTSAITQIENVLAALSHRGRTRVSIHEAAQDLIDGMLNYDPTKFIPSGFSDLDRVTNGWERGQLVLVAGRPGMGKSALAFSSAIKTARANRGVMLFSLEMTNRDVASRMLTDITWEKSSERIEYKDLRGAGVSNDDKAVYKLAHAANNLANVPLVLDEQAGLQIAEIAARIRETAGTMAKNGQRLDLVVIDHLGLIKPSGHYKGNKVAETGEISGQLKKLAKDLNVAIMALSQLNRANEGRDNKRPSLADLRNSGDLEQDADIVCFAYREAYYLERAKYDDGSHEELERRQALSDCRNAMELVIAKNRNGPCDTINLFCDMASNAVRDAA
jgi:replicative DNA helicase